MYALLHLPTATYVHISDVLLTKALFNTPFEALKFMNGTVFMLSSGKYEGVYCIRSTQYWNLSLQLSHAKDFGNYVPNYQIEIVEVPDVI